MRKVLKTTLGIKKRETVLIVTDDNKVEVASIIERATKSLSDEVLTIKMMPRSRHAEEPPRAVSEAMKVSDVVIMPTTMSLTHTNARKKACEEGARIASMPGITLEMLTKGGMRADYKKVKKISDKLTELLTISNSIKIESSLGTSLTASLKGRKGISDSGIFTEKGAFGNLPAGEGFIAPVESESEGTIVFDGSIAGVGVLDSLVEVSIQDGRVVKVRGDKGKLGRMLRKYKNADHIAEIGIGANPKARIIGNVLEDEKVLGTAHIAFGDNHTFGGNILSLIHI